MLNVTMLSFIMLNVFKLNIVMLSVTVLYTYADCDHACVIMNCHYAKCVCDVTLC